MKQLLVSLLNCLSNIYDDLEEAILVNPEEFTHEEDCRCARCYWTADQMIF